MNEDLKKTNIINKIITKEKKQNNYNWDEM